MNRKLRLFFSIVDETENNSEIFRLDMFLKSFMGVPLFNQDKFIIIVYVGKKTEFTATRLNRYRAINRANGIDNFSTIGL